MFLSKSPSGIYYLYFFDARGIRQKVSTHAKLKTDALAFLQSFKQEKKMARSRVLLSCFKKELISHIEVQYTKATVKVYTHAFDTLLEIIGDVPLHSVSMRDVDLYKSERLKKVKPITVNTRLIALKSAFNFAMRWKYIGENPFAHVRFCSIPQQTTIFFTREDFQ